MFRPMRREKQQVSADECRAVLQTAKRGVLSVHGEDGAAQAALEWLFLSAQ